jgi:hypothetical protein
MPNFLAFLLRLVTSPFRATVDLEIEVLVLRQQLAIYQRKQTRSAPVGGGGDGASTASAINYRDRTAIKKRAHAHTTMTRVMSPRRSFW